MGTKNNGYTIDCEFGLKRLPSHDSPQRKCFFSLLDRVTVFGPRDIHVTSFCHMIAGSEVLLFFSGQSECFWGHVTAFCHMIADLEVLLFFTGQSDCFGVTWHSRDKFLSHDSWQRSATFLYWTRWLFWSHVTFTWHLSVTWQLTTKRFCSSLDKAIVFDHLTFTWRLSDT